MNRLGLYAVIVAAGFMLAPISAFAQRPPTVAPTRCVISMPLWCIASSSGVDMRSEGQDRIWSLRQDHMPDGPLTIVEGSCDAAELSQSGVADDQTSVDEPGRRSRSIKYWLNKEEGCSLTFSYVLTPNAFGDVYDAVIISRIIVGVRTVVLK